MFCGEKCHGADYNMLSEAYFSRLRAHMYGTPRASSLWPHSHTPLPLDLPAPSHVFASTFALSCRGQRFNDNSKQLHLFHLYSARWVHVLSRCTRLMSGQSIRLSHLSPLTTHHSPPCIPLLSTCVLPFRASPRAPALPTVAPVVAPRDAANVCHAHPL